MRDLRYAARVLLQARGWTAVVVASLALGIGANTALFSAVNGLLLRKLPVRDPDSLVRVRAAGPNHVRTDVLVYGRTAPDAQGRDIGPTFSYPMYLEFAAANRTLSDLFACARIGTVNIVVNGQAEIASAFLSSGNYYGALAVRADLGRTIVPDDDRPTAPPVAVISHKYWMSRFGGNPDIVGAQARVNNAPVTIVGVLPARFTGVDRVVDEPPDVSMPIALQPQVMLQPSILQASLLNAPNFWWVEVMGRLKPGATVAQVQGNLAGVFGQAARTGFESFLSSLTPEWRSRFTQQDRTQTPELLVDSGSRGMYDADTGDLRTATVLTAVVALVLLIVCANVANLLLSRATARRRELSVRLALGATRATLVRQLLAESVLLAGVGGALGLLIGRWGVQLLPMAANDASPLDWRVMAFAAGLSLGTALIFGLVPALRATTDVNPALKETTSGAARAGTVLGKSLVVAQVTISLVLLVAAGLFLRTVQNLRTVDVGFNPRNLVLFRVSPALNRYDAQRQARLYEQIGDRLRRIGGVRSVAWSNPSLMSGRTFGTAVFIQGRTYPEGRGDQIAQISVSPEFFETMEIPLVAGRGFTAGDTKNTPPVAVINEAARKYFADRSPIGRRFGKNPIDTSYEIVGVIRDAKYNTLRTPAVPTLYGPFLQGNPGSATFEVRTAGDPRGAIGAVRDAVRDVDPNLPLINLTTGLEEIEGRFADERLFSRAYSLFGALALFVAALGLFGLMSYSVARRTSEIGVRMALGADRRDVLRLVMRESMTLAAAGVAIGLAGALAASRLVASLLFGLAPTDPVTIGGATAVMLLVSALAGYLPARRASLVEPLAALRYE